LFHLLKELHVWGIPHLYLIPNSNKERNSQDDNLGDFVDFCGESCMHASHVPLVLNLSSDYSYFLCLPGSEASLEHNHDKYVILAM